MSGSSPLSLWLRSIGVAALCGAAVAFLVQGWAEQTTLTRELSWAALTVFLTLFGVYAVRKLGDAAGARVALALAAASIPVHFAVVGSAFWSYWREGLGSFGDVLAAALVLVPLAPALGLGATALVGRGAAGLTACLFSSCAVLLVPTRDGDVVAALVSAQLVVLALLERFAWSRDVRFGTREGGYARALLVAPVVILLVRNADYPATQLWYASLLLLPSVLVAALPRLVVLPSRIDAGARLLGGLGVSAAVIVALPDTLWAYLAVSGVLVAGAFGTRLDARLFAAGALLVFGGAALASLVQTDLVYALAVVPAGVLLTGLGFHRRCRELAVAAPLATLVGLGGQVAARVSWPAQQGWMVAAAIGAGFLVVASIIDNRRDRLARLWSKMNEHWAGRREFEADGEVSP